MRIDTGRCLLASSHWRRLGWLAGAMRRAGDDQAVEPQDRGLSGLHRIRQGRVQEDASRCRDRLRGLPERGLQDDDPGGARRLRPARRLLQLVRRGRGAAGPRRAGPRHQRTRQRRRRLPPLALRGLAGFLHVRRQELRHPDGCRVEIFLLQQELLRRARPDAAGNLRRPPRPVPEGARDRPEHGADPVRKLRALEAQPLHHDVQRARAWRRRHRGRLRADRARGSALHQSRLCRGVAEGARHEAGRLLAGRAQRDLAGSLALDVLGRAIADDILRHLVRRHLRR